MMRFLQQDPRFKHQLQLISVHIPKCAGTSFRNTLKAVYGEESVVRLDISLQDERIRLNEEIWQKSKVPTQVKVAHGHFSPTLFQKYFRTNAAPYITWLRHPVDRVISNYYYLSKRLAEELEEEKKGLNILSKMQRTLMEYAADPFNQNRISKFLASNTLGDFMFVGIQEFYEQDLQALSKLLNWENTPHFKHNVTGKKHEVDREIRAQIAAYNMQDMQLYQEALRLREKRIMS
jgi:hypothetical protein